MPYLIRWINSSGFHETEFGIIDHVQTFVDILMGNEFEMIQVSEIKEKEVREVKEGY